MPFSTKRMIAREAVVNIFGDTTQHGRMVSSPNTIELSTDVSLNEPDVHRDLLADSP